MGKVKGNCFGYRKSKRELLPIETPLYGQTSVISRPCLYSIYLALYRLKHNIRSGADRYQGIYNQS